MLESQSFCVAGTLTSFDSAHVQIVQLAECRLAQVGVRHLRDAAAAQIDDARDN